MTVERLQKIMEHLELSPSALADAIGVPRSSISHLVSGRNKPSLDLVLKLSRTYPSINLNWLLHGEGEFTGAPPTTQASLFEENPAKPPAATPIIADTPTKETLSPAKAETEKEKKSISKIVIFNEDGTFEAYQPKE